MAVTINGSNTPTAGGVTYGDGTQYATTSAGSAGGVLYSAGSSAPAFTAAGTSGQVLTSAGSGAPTWSTPSAGALVYLSTQTVSGTPSTVDFTTGFSSTYDDYVIRYENVTATASSNELAFRVQKSGTFRAAGYAYQYSETRNATFSGSGVSSAGFIQLESGNQTNTDKRCGIIEMFNFNSTEASASQVIATISCTNGTVNVSVAGGSQNTAAAVTGVRIFFGSGTTFTSGTFRLYGVAKA